MSNAAALAAVSDIKAFVLAKCLLTAIDLGLFEKMSSGGASVGDAAALLNLDPQMVETMVAVLAAGGYLRGSGPSACLTTDGEAVAEASARLRPWAAEMDLTFASIANLATIVRTGETSDTALSNYWSYRTSESRGALNSGDTSAYSTNRISRTAHTVRQFSLHGTSLTTSRSFN